MEEQQNRETECLNYNPGSDLPSTEKRKAAVEAGVGGRL